MSKLCAIRITPFDILAECSIAGTASEHEAVVSLKMKHTEE
jgi:hypothetical protein